MSKKNPKPDVFFDEKQKEPEEEEQGHKSSQAVTPKSPKEASKGDLNKEGLQIGANPSEVPSADTCASLSNTDAPQEAQLSRSPEDTFQQDPSPDDTPRETSQQDKTNENFTRENFE
jgi:hypothetical protein